MVKLQIDVEELKPLEPRFKKVAKRTVVLTANELQRNLKKLSPVDHGRLQGSWVIFQTGELERTVKSSAKYAIFVNDGTGLYGPLGHKIRPKNGKFLAFTPNKGKFKGKLIVVPWTRGQKPQRFVERSMEMTERRVQEFMIRACMEIDS